MDYTIRSVIMLQETNQDATPVNLSSHPSSQIRMNPAIADFVQTLRNFPSKNIQINYQPGSGIQEIIRTVHSARNESFPETTILISPQMLQDPIRVINNNFRTYYSSIYNPAIINNVNSAIRQNGSRDIYGEFLSPAGAFRRRANVQLIPSSCSGINYYSVDAYSFNRCNSLDRSYFRCPMIHAIPPSQLLQPNQSFKLMQSVQSMPSNDVNDANVPMKTTKEQDLDATIPIPNIGEEAPKISVGNRREGKDFLLGAKCFL